MTAIAWAIVFCGLTYQEAEMIKYLERVVNGPRSSIVFFGGLSSALRILIVAYLIYYTVRAML